MPAFDHGDESDAIRRARVARLETLRDLSALMAELAELRRELAVCEDDEEQVRELLHMAGVMTGVWLDDVACRFAGTDHTADELFAAAWRLLDDMAVEPGAFSTLEDPALFQILNGSAASLLSRLWINGYLIGPFPHDTWPNHDLALLLLRTLEHHADALALTDALDHHNHPPPAGPPPDETTENKHSTDEPDTIQDRRVTSIPIPLAPR
ncbi:hypothetical protein [Streptomyces djakartensis]|uniref:hypothetical protein n=1 Tax=Streptomyces djakartensis TaxID=68193 RepID=UPI0034E05391